MSFSTLFKKKYYPLNKIEISADAMLHNYHYLSRLAPGIAVAPVLKSNAYGHGLIPVAKVLDAVGAPFFCIDSLYEAYELLKNKIQTPLLIMGYVSPDNLKVKKLPFSYAVYDTALVAAISKYQPDAGIHIFVDTGMHREGISLEELPAFLDSIKSYRNLNVEGLLSHLAAADQYNDPFTQKQISNFEKAKEIVHKAGFRLKWFHLSASSGLLHHEQYRGKIGTVARAGIALYGIDPEGKNTNLQPALQLKTTLNQVKFLAKGEKVGYDFTYAAEKDMIIGILPIGYHDGLDHRLSNKGFVSIIGSESENVFCPIIGRVSMNLTIVDLSAVKNPQVGESVTVYSCRPEEKNSVSTIAKLCDTIPYEVLIHLAASTKRIVVFSNTK